MQTELRREKNLRFAAIIIDRTAHKRQEQHIINIIGPWL